MDNRPIGIFDSGVGGLTVAKEVMRELENEQIIYYGDTARVPYGSKSKDTIIKFSEQIIRFLKTKNVKAIVIACGTASAMALQSVKNDFDIPIIGVVEAGATAAVKSTKNQKIGLIGTEGTIDSGAYERVIHSCNEQTLVYGVACPLFVPLIEEGWLDDIITLNVAKRYLKDFNCKDIDTLILGCTHYPLLFNMIEGVVGENIKLINPAFETALVLRTLLSEKGMLNEGVRGGHCYYVSDRAQKFERLAKMILNKEMLPVEQIDIEMY